MSSPWFRRYIVAVFAAVLVMAGGFGTVYADFSSSTNYMVNETQFGAGASLQDCSTNYCAKTSVGDTGVGFTKSNNYSAWNGFNTSSDPFLEVWTDGGSHDLGTLNVNTTATASGVIKVRNYLSSGYVVQITGPPLAMGSHSLTNLTTPTTSHAGAEQFGMNMVANTAPAVGANPTQQVDSTMSFGYAATDYDTANLFKYVDGDIVAKSDSSSGETDYTLSMIVNISNITPGGRYTGSYSAVIVPMY
jgi:hypothetical protein